MENKLDLSTCTTMSLFNYDGQWRKTRAVGHETHSLFCERLTTRKSTLGIGDKRCGGTNLIIISVIIVNHCLPLDEVEENESNVSTVLTDRDRLASTS